MKKITSLMLLLFTTFGFAQSFPLDFESTTINYGFTGFDGGDLTKVANPSATGINMSANVCKLVKGAGAVWAGGLVTMAAPMDFTTNKYIKVKVWSPRAGAKLNLKVENGPINYEKEVVIPVANTWTELGFDYSAIPANAMTSCTKLVFIFDLGTVGDGTPNFTFYFDDVVLTTVPVNTLTQMDLPVTFDATTVDYNLIGFGGAENSTIVADPTNAANKVAKVVKTAGAETWAGTTISAASGSGFLTNIPFSATANKMNVRVWSPNAGIKVRMKVEDKTNGAISVETEATTTVANGWQTLEFDFTTPTVPPTSAIDYTKSYNKASIFFNFGVNGATAGEKTYYFDDVKFGAAVQSLTQMDLPVTFDANNVNYGVIGFGGAENSSIVVDPTNAANKVVKVIKSAAAELWAGTTVSTITGSVQTGFATNIPFSATATKMNVRVWSPDAGIKVRLKVEDKTNGGISVETEATTTVASGWETLEFNFANNAPNTTAIDYTKSYNKASIFFNFGVTGAAAGEKTYYFDDVKFGAIPVTLTQMNLPVTFDATTVDYGVAGFGGAENSTIVADPTNATNKVVKVVKSAGAETWAGTTVTATANKGFATNIPFTATSKKMSVRVWSPNAGITVRLKVEDKTNGAVACETDKAVTTASGWETLVFDFGTQASGTPALDITKSYNLASIFFNFGVNGATAGEKTYYFDDVTFGDALSTDSFESSKIAMYPNPTADFVTIEAKNNIDNIAIFNVLGQEVLNTNPKNVSTTLDLSTLKSGIYIVRSTIEGKVSSSRIVKK